MQNRSQVINKLALVLLSIVVLELVLIGDQVQPVKSIKKKIALKKLKKLLPLLALVKPKKKIIVVPIPFPMFKHHGQTGFNQRPLYGQQHQPAVHQSRPHPNNMMLDGTGPPMSFVMMQEPGGLVLDSMMQMSPASSMSNGMMSSGPMLFGPPSAANSSSGFADDATMSMLMPSMTMTIQSEPNGSSAIELSTNMATGASGNSSRLRAPQSPSKWRPNPSPEQLLDDHQQQSPDGEHYYSSPWSTKSPLSSPAKVYRQRGPQSGRLQQPPKAVVMIRNQWRPSSAQVQVQYQQQQLNHNQNRYPLQQQQQHKQQQQYQYQQQQQHHQEQQLIQAPEIEELVPVGPAQMLPIYQSSNGQLHISLPESHRAVPVEDNRGSNQPGTALSNNNADSEVGLLTDARRAPQQPESNRAISGPARLTSSPPAATKGKQQSSKASPAGGY